jgi:List-Bact-rpt repeat protein
MRSRRVVASAALGAAIVAAVAFVVVPVAGGSPSKRSGCSGPDITSLAATAITDRSALLVFSFVSPNSSGAYEGVIWSPESGGFGGAFSAPGGTFSASLGSLIPDTHYRGTLTVRNDCGEDSMLIDFRTPKTPPPPPCGGAPAIDDVQVGSVTQDTALVTYSIRSGDAVTAHVLVDPGGIDLAGTFAPPGGAGQAPLSGLAANTAYTVRLVARNGCGESSRQVTFTTVRPTDCSVAPFVDDLRVVAIEERSAAVVYAVRSDGKVTTRVRVSPGTVSRVATLSAPGGGNRIQLARLTPATRYSVALTVTNECGQASARTRFRSFARVAVGVVGSGKVTSRPAGISCTRTCAGPFKPGSTIRLTARPAPNWRFFGWGGDCRGSAPVCSLKARNDTVTARFRLVPACATGQSPTPARPCRR